MTDEEVRSKVLEQLIKVAPEAGEQELDPAVNFRDQFDFDSIDFLNFLMGLQKAFDHEIPEKDYPRFATLDGAVSYLRELSD